MKKNLGYASLYTFAYGALGVLLPLLGQYLKFIGFSGTQIGSITSAGTATAIIASTFWGSMYNRSENKKWFILKLSVAAAAVCFTLHFVHAYVLFLLLVCLLYFFQAPTISLVDAMTVEDGKFIGTIRKWGAIGFAAGVFFAGRIAETTGLSIIFFLYSGCFTIFAAILFMMARGGRRKASSASETKKGGALLSIIKNKKFVKLVVCTFFIGGTTAAHNTFFGFLFVQGGGSIAGIGLAFLLMAGSEAPFIAYEDKLSKIFTLEKMLFAAMFIGMARYIWYSMCPSATLLLIFFFLQGMSIGIIIVTFVKYIAKTVSCDDFGIAISVYYAFGSAFSTIVCQMASGIILDYFGAAGVYRFFACMNLIGVILYFLWKLYKKHDI